MHRNGCLQKVYAVLFMVVLCALTACGEEKVGADNHIHSFSMWEITTESSCITQGMQTRKCSTCGFLEYSQLPVQGHTLLIDDAVTATCTTEGKTEGSHCSVCKQVVVAQMTVAATGHDWKAATYDSPKICEICGEREGAPLSVVCAVKEAYEDALALAKQNGKDQDYSYVLLHSELLSLLGEISVNNYDESSAEKYFGEVRSKEEAEQMLTKILTYVLADDSDYLSALMRQFAACDSVKGTIMTTHVDIEVADVKLLLDELHIQPEVLGRILAMLDVYDYTWLSDSASHLLQFTEYGFTYHWESLTYYVLNLGYEASPLTAKDFVVRILDEGQEDVDTIAEFKNAGLKNNCLAVYDDKNSEEGDENYYEQLLTNRGVFVGSSLDSVLLAYGQTDIINASVDGIPYSEWFSNVLADDPYIEKLFNKQCVTYVMYYYQTNYSICFCFDKDREVSWIVYFYGEY